MDKIILRRYFIYGLVGICLEVFWTGLESLFQNYDLTMEGTSYIWMFFIYGLAVFMEPIQDKLRRFNFIVRGIIYMVLIFIAEGITGLLLREFIGSCPWHYTGSWAIGDGVITLYFMPVWFSLGLILEKIHEILDHMKITYKAE